ncbi:MAG: exodeoxyribonuclease VII small subunit [Synergistaceae bacterium]|nr:exodeoxyribonuclease VII small subunit [Synergistaceae bacterium]
MDFSKKLEELEKILAELEDEAKPLEETLASYEKGVALFKECFEFINDAEKKIHFLSEKDLDDLGGTVQDGM